MVGLRSNDSIDFINIKLESIRTSNAWPKLICLSKRGYQLHCTKEGIINK